MTNDGSNSMKDHPVVSHLDLVPKGRDEEGLEGPQDWVRYHDSYED